MHILKAGSISALLGLALINTALAATPAPLKCPGAADIKAQEENNTVTCTGEDCTFNMENHRFDTDLYWHFFMKLKASSLDDAKTKVHDALGSLAYQSGPDKETDDLYFCHYSNSYGFEAIAAYSPDSKLSLAISR